MAAAMALPVMGDQLDKCALSAVVVPSPAAPTPLQRGAPSATVVVAAAAAAAISVVLH